MLIPSGRFGYESAPGFVWLSVTRIFSRTQRGGWGEGFWPEWSKHVARIIRTWKREEDRTFVE